MIKVLLFCLFCTAAHADSLPKPWHLGSKRVEEALPAAINTLDIQPGPQRVVVAVIDGAVYAQHPLLKGKTLPGINLTSKSVQEEKTVEQSSNESLKEKCQSKKHDVHSMTTHGTEVASLVAGSTDVYQLGVNSNALILPIQVVKNCVASQSDVKKAIQWAAGMQVESWPVNPYPAKIINLSISGREENCHHDLASLTAALQAKGVFIVAAAGNTRGKELRSPASCPGVISVGSITSLNAVASYSSMDSRITVYAPGGGSSHRVNAKETDLLVGSFRSEIDVGNVKPTLSSGHVGTSYAAPIVSGFISLWLSKNPELLPEDFLAALETYGRRLSEQGCVDCELIGLNGGAMMLYQRRCLASGQVVEQSKARESVWRRFYLGSACNQLLNHAEIKQPVKSMDIEKVGG